MNDSTEAEENSKLLTFGAGMFFYLALISFLYLIVFMVLKYVMIIASIDPLINFWVCSLLYLVLFTIIILKVFNTIKEKKLSRNIAKDLLKNSIIALIVIQILQFVAASFLFDFVIANYPLELESYEEGTRAGYFISIEGGIELISYLVLGFLVYRK